MVKPSLGGNIDDHLRCVVECGGLQIKTYSLAADSRQSFHSGGLGVEYSPTLSDLKEDEGLTYIRKSNKGKLAVIFRSSALYCFCSTLCTV